MAADVTWVGMQCRLSRVLDRLGNITGALRVRAADAVHAGDHGEGHRLEDIVTRLEQLVSELERQL